MVKSMKILLIMNRRLARVRKATRGHVALQKLAQKLEVSALIFARSALEVRGVFASLSVRSSSIMPAV
jgi:hypothetical protein